MKYRSIEDCDSIQTELVKTLKDLLSIPSTKGVPECGAPFGKETKRALEYMLCEGNKMGFRTLDLDGFAGYIEFGEGDREISILCHLDVVPAGEGWKFDPFTPFIQDGKLFGRGTNDDKGPAVATLYSMKSLKEQGYVPPCRIRLILGLDEESGSQCMAHYKSKQALPDLGFTPDAKFPVIFAEKGILHIKIKGEFDTTFPATESIVLISGFGGERANMVPATCTISWINNPANKLITNDLFLNLSKINNKELSADKDEKVQIYCNSADSESVGKENMVNSNFANVSIVQKTITGAPGHASMPEFGVNAISKAMIELYELFADKQMSHPFIKFYNDFFGITTDGSLLGIDYNDCESGALTCNVGLLELTTSGVEMTVDIRYPVTANPEEICSIIRDKCEATGLIIDDIVDNPPLYVDKNSVLVSTLLNVYNETTSSDSKPVAIGGGTYARSIPNIVAFGPNFIKEDDVAHQAGEYIKLDDLFLCEKIYQKAIQALALVVTNSKNN